MRGTYGCGSAYDTHPSHLKAGDTEERHAATAEMC
jgi:hypothetical protein